MFADTFRDRTVWISGHTGFKGAWLCEWLLLLGARVHGYSLPAPTSPALFDQLGLSERIQSHEIGDVRDANAVRASLAACRPDFVFHLAAQSLVRPSYRDPVETFSTNVMGTVQVLEGLRHFEHPCAAVFVTTDKVYENREWVYGYRENDPLGGRDPYSASKAASEHAIAAYRSSFFSAHDSLVRIASARAGNVIGGGDWAADRIVPDAIRALHQGDAVPVRNPHATRPWQHVLEPLGGYLLLAARLARSGTLPASFNFGPDLDSNRTVTELLQTVFQYWPGSIDDCSSSSAPHEAGQLNLASNLSSEVLGWRPLWGFDLTVQQTVSWYRKFLEDRSQARSITLKQIREYGDEFSTRHPRRQVS